MARRLLSLTSLLLLGACATRVVPITNSVDTTHIDYSNASQIQAGQSCQDFVLGIFPVGDDMSLFDAIERAGIRRVTMLEYGVTNHVVFTERCVIVHGDDEAPVAPAPAPAPAPPAVAIPDTTAE